MNWIDKLQPQWSNFLLFGRRKFAILLWPRRGSYGGLLLKLLTCSWANYSDCSSDFVFVHSFSLTNLLTMRLLVCGTWLICSPHLFMTEAFKTNWTDFIITCFPLVLPDGIWLITQLVVSFAGLGRVSSYPLVDELDLKWFLWLSIRWFILLVDHSMPFNLVV